MAKKLRYFFFILFTISLNAQWVQKNSGVGANLYDVYCINENTVIVVGSSGVILKTTDGGENWIQKTSSTNADLMKVQFLNPNLGFAVGGNGTLVKTTDAGETWTAIATGETANLYGLSVLSEDVFYISGENGYIKKTTNGGTSFITRSATTDFTVSDIRYFNENTGYAQSEKLLKTVDGGLTWNAITDYSSSFFFLNENTGIVNTNGGLYKTTDGGANLSYLEFSGFTSNETILFSLNENVIWQIQNSDMLCGCSTHCITKNEVINNSDYHSIRNCGIGSIQWGVRFEGIYFANETTGFAVGAFGAIYKNSTGTMLSVDNIDKKDTVKIYPNPASDYVSVSFDEKSTLPFSVEITDLLGKKVYSKSYGAENLTTINTASFSRGAYLMTVITSEKRQTQKLIID